MVGIPKEKPRTLVLGGLYDADLRIQNVKSIISGDGHHGSWQ